MSPKTDTKKSAKSASATRKAVKGFTDEERAAMKERVQELKAEARRGPRPKKADGESDVLAKIAEMPKSDRAMAKRLHAIIKASAPALSPRTWYGMPAYAKDGKVVCFFQSAQKFKTRYATFGFSDEANREEGAMWPTAFALTALTAADEGKDRRAREESGELRAELDTGPHLEPSTPTPPARRSSQLATGVAGSSAHPARRSDRSATAHRLVGRTHSPRARN